MRASIAVLAFLALTVRAKGDWGRSSADRTSRTAGDCRPERRDGDGCWRCAVLDASRLARNGRDWHHLLELCGLVGARVIDLDGVYDPCRPNDRLLLGMKGSISEFELGVLRARMYDAARSKARRGELRIGVPVGYVWDPRDWPRPRPRHAAPGGGPSHLPRFRELGSARQVLLSLVADQLHFPRPSDARRMIAFDWTPIVIATSYRSSRTPSTPAPLEAVRNRRQV